MTTINRDTVVAELQRWARHHDAHVTAAVKLLKRLAEIDHLLGEHGRN